MLCAHAPPGRVGAGSRVPRRARAGCGAGPAPEGFAPPRRFPVVLCPVPGSEGDGALVQLTLASQAGGPRGRVYLPYIGFRVTRPLQARPPLGAALLARCGWVCCGSDLGVRRRCLLRAGNYRAACARTGCAAGVWRGRRRAAGQLRPAVTPAIKASSAHALMLHDPLCFRQCAGGRGGAAGVARGGVRAAPGPARRGRGSRRRQRPARGGGDRHAARHLAHGRRRPHRLRQARATHARYRAAKGPIGRVAPSLGAPPAPARAPDAVVRLRAGGQHDARCLTTRQPRCPACGLRGEPLAMATLCGATADIAQAAPDPVSGPAPAVQRPRRP
jgi:hypothetical protein